MNKDRWKLTTKDIALIGIMVALIEACKIAIAWIPNVELTSFWLIMFTLYFGWKVIYVVPVFIILEGFVYGINLWWIMYLYAWPILCILTALLRKIESSWNLAILSGVFGLSFGLMCSIPYVLIGSLDGGVKNGIHAGFTWWVAGIPWDIVHGISNFLIMLVLYRPIKEVLKKVKMHGEI